MGTVTAAAAISLAAAAASSPSGRRLRRGPVFVRCSSSAADERQALFSRIAPVYDQLNDVLSLGQHRTWKRICVSWSRAKRGDRVLDLCCGSGDLAFLLSQKVGLDGEVMAVDFSRQQLQNAADRQEQRWKLCYKNIKWIEGDALDLPFTGCYFDAVTVGYGLRNVVDKSKAMQEIFRVLKPGSRASILDFNKSSSLFTALLQSWMIDNVVVPFASGYGLTEEYKYLKSSIAQYFTGEELEKLAKEAGFSVAKHYELGGGFMGNLVATR
ncbi:2-phytyl-1,4-beta-naphthoquinone methyltransferase, chloroplastic isoform X1 [Phragmites australis]|uniref:2-phytyl-1,4-beta-naphthoquinone methyltransferase, chloroplastic isoform X1 n=1 Tax=Phragmites australis TaxID=29695 RepID=UPI002D76AB1E|nr:2-phytyl-1,4-beta-naphthoquinone methyltransferase, chloroplastic isoform X1 [Phragmites australis]